MNIFSQIAVLILIAVVGVGFLMFAGGWRPTIPGRKTPPEAPQVPPTAGATMLPPILYIDQLDPATMRQIKRFELTDIPTTGASISRPNAPSGTIKLDGSVREAYSVSANHARIGMDDQGLFIQDQKGTRRMRHGKTKQVIDEIEITNGLIIYLGLQPLRFVIPDFWSTTPAGNSDTNLFDSFDNTCQYHTQAFGRRNRQY